MAHCGSGHFRRCITTTTQRLASSLARSPYRSPTGASSTGWSSRVLPFLNLLPSSSSALASPCWVAFFGSTLGIAEGLHSAIRLRIGERRGGTDDSSLSSVTGPRNRASRAGPIGRALRRSPTESSSPPPIEHRYRLPL